MSSSREFLLDSFFIYFYYLLFYFIILFILVLRATHDLFKSAKFIILTITFSVHISTFSRVGRKESLAYDPNNNANTIPNFHIPPAVNKFGNYTQVFGNQDFLNSKMLILLFYSVWNLQFYWYISNAHLQVQMLGEDLQHHAATRRPMSPVVSQPIRWECNRSNKGSSPPRITKGTPNKNTSPVRHRTPSPQRFKSPDRAARVSSI